MLYPIVTLTPTAQRWFGRKDWISYESVSNVVRFYRGPRKKNPDGTFSIYLNRKKNGQTVTIKINVVEENVGHFRSLKITSLHTMNPRDPTDYLEE